MRFFLKPAVSVWDSTSLRTMPPKVKPASKTPLIATAIFGIVALAAAFYLSAMAEPEEPPPPPPKFLGIF